MTLIIENPEAERLARELADVTGESLTEAVLVALRDRLSIVRRRSMRTVVRSEIAAIQEFVASLPDRDRRSPDEIIGYDDFALSR